MAFGLLLSLPAFSNTSAELAAEAFALRDFNEAGVQKVVEAIGLYEKALAEETDTTVALNLRNKKATAHYFLGTALSNKDEMIEEHEAAMSLADSVMSAFGVKPDTAHELSSDQIIQLMNALGDSEEAILAEAFYAKGISLAQWGNLKGAISAISRLPEVFGLMGQIEMMGQESIHEYGPYRTIGRIKFVLPADFGGDLESSEDYLKKATVATLAPGQRYSLNGYNNLYFAETLYARGKETLAIRVLQAFVEADFSTLPVGSAPENRQALAQANKLLIDWK